MSFFGGERKDERSKSLNWLDWSLLSLAVLSVVCGFFLVRWLSGDASGEAVEVVYIVTVSEVDVELYENAPLFFVGEYVTSQNGTAILGEIVETQIVPHRRFVVQNNKTELVEEEGVVDHLVTVRSTGRRREGDGVRIGDIRIAVGMHLTLRIGDFYAQNSMVSAMQWEVME